MSKVLISSIGVGHSSLSDKPSNYARTNYRFENDTDSVDTVFIIEPIIERCCPDHVLLLGTKESCWRALFWQYALETQEKDPSITDAEIEEYIEQLDQIKENKYDADYEKLDQVDFSFLCKVLQIRFGCEFQICLLKYGLNREENWGNFERISRIDQWLNPEEKMLVSLDITHSFRSLPFYQYMCVNYLAEISDSNIEIENIFYGMFEANREIGYTPVVNLNDTSKLLELVNGIHALHTYGNVKTISESLGENSQVQKLLQVFEYSISTNDFHKIAYSVEQLQQNLVSGHEEAPYEKALLLHLQEKMGRFKLSDHLREAKLQFEMAKWYWEQCRYGQAITILQETVRTFLVSILMRCEKGKFSSWKLDREDHRKSSLDELRKIVEWKNQASEEFNYAWLLQYYNRGREIRNKVAHNLFNSDDIGKKLNIDDIMDEMNENIEFLNHYMEGVEYIILKDINWHRQFKLDVNKFHMQQQPNLLENITSIVVIGNRENEVFSDIRKKYMNVGTIDFLKGDLLKKYQKKGKSKKERKECISCILQSLTSCEKGCTVIAIKHSDLITDVKLYQMLRRNGYNAKVLELNGQGVYDLMNLEISEE